MANLIIFREDYDTYDALEGVLNYIDDSNRARYIGGQNILLRNSMEQAMAVNKFFYNQTRKKIYHFTISFDDDELMTAQPLYEEGYNVCALFPEYQALFAVHQDTEHIHMHFAIIPVNLASGRKMYFDNETLYTFAVNLRKIFEKYHVKINILWE